MEHMGELFRIADLDNSTCGLRYRRCNASPRLSSERRIECTFLDTTHRLFGRPRIENCNYFQHSQADDCAEVRSIVGRFYWVGSLTGDKIGCFRVPILSYYDHICLLSFLFTNSGHCGIHPFITKEDAPCFLWR